MNGLLRSRKFWIAIVAVIQSILFQFVPNFPPAVWQAIDLLAGTLIVGIAVEDAGAKVRNPTPPEIKVAIVPPPDKPQ